MKITLNSIFLFLLLAATVFAGAFVTIFTVSNQGDNIEITWSTSQETNLKDFIIQRKTYQSDYTDIATIQPKGNNSSYSYIDRAAYKTNDVLYIYRLKIEDNDGSVSYLEQQSISHSISAVKRTWGSIKAMFR
jgi:dolichyl-phosphate-mannose--protein O-mannosyl transferase